MKTINVNEIRVSGEKLQKNLFFTTQEVCIIGNLTQVPPSSGVDIEVVPGYFRKFRLAVSNRDLFEVMHRPWKEVTET